ncbi:cytochrome P450 [Plectosphaerella plurivora]|uniref:Cytochrome P450 n=1 Tax=Plectosphaerella plurivora TaxID=936078 RepID=A0A9P8VCC1_9PEZI|nr:cytochrome P450 [Plectosphaerella plurivora]
MLLDKLVEVVSVAGWATVLSTLFAVYVSGVVIYRLYFHPLAKYPGPFWAKISGFPAHYHTQKRNRHIWFHSLQQKYGPTFRYTPDSILVNTPSGYQEIFNPKANIGKSVYYDTYVRNSVAFTTWNSTNKDIHARKRRVLTNCFSDKAIRNAEPYIHQNLDRWCGLLQDEIDKNGEWSESLNMADWSNHLIFDILGDLCFGKSFDMKEPDNELRFVPELMSTFLCVMHPIAFSPFAPLWVWLKPRGLDALLATTAPPALANWGGFVAKCFQDRAALEEDLKKNPKPESEIRKDFFHYLFGAIDPETGKPGYTLSELFGETEMMLVAGSDTTSITTAAAIFYLVRNPAVQTRLAKEIRGKFNNPEDIKSGPRLQNDCTYLQAFIKEVLRVSSPAPAEMGRVVLKGGAVIEGDFLPEGIKASTSTYCMHHSPKLYDEPFEFRPERWIVGEKGSTVESVACAESGYMPFSTGPRGCIGKNLAYLEMSLVVGKLVHGFELKQDPKSNNLGGGRPDMEEGRRDPEQFQLFEIFVGMRDGPIVQLKRRA